jgi:hypothetical protein
MFKNHKQSIASGAAGWNCISNEEFSFSEKLHLQSENLNLVLKDVAQGRYSVMQVLCTASDVQLDEVVNWSCRADKSRSKVVQWFHVLFKNTPLVVPTLDHNTATSQPQVQVCEISMFVIVLYMTFIGIPVAKLFQVSHLGSGGSKTLRLDFQAAVSPLAK